MTDLPSARPAGALPGTTGELQFESRFESGNLLAAARVGEEEYDLVLHPDYRCPRQTQWFYFRVHGAKKDVPYTFHILNFFKRTSLYNKGMRPLMYSERSERRGEGAWRRAGKNIFYHKNLETPRFMTLTFTLKFPLDDDTCYIAMSYPYTLTDVQQHLESIVANPISRENLHRFNLAVTLAGNECEGLVIPARDHEPIMALLEGVSNTSARERAKKRAEATELLKASDVFHKRIIVLTGRVHPGETGASYVMEGILDLLTSRNDPVAIELRRRYTFVVIPMLNPDGVVVGNTRCGLDGNDHNRCYSNPLDGFQSVLHRLKDLVRRLQSESEVALYCDFHGHSRRFGAFMYGCNTVPDGAITRAQEENEKSSRIFVQEMARESGDFDINSCYFAVQPGKESTGRVVMWKEVGISQAFTFEVSFCGAHGRHFTQKNLCEQGVSFCQSLLSWSRQVYREKTSEHPLPHIDYFLIWTGL